MRQLAACLKKDYREFLRGRKNVLCLLVLLCLSTAVLAVTKLFPLLLAQVLGRAPGFLTDSEAMGERLARFFPADVKGSLGILASDIGVFYSIVAVWMSFSLIPAELRAGKWILPVQAGYRAETLLLSKCLIYAAGTAFPVFVIYQVYYMAASALLEANLAYTTAVLNALTLSFGIASIVMAAMLLSVLQRGNIWAALTVLLTVIAAPDVLTFFSFGKWLPTYILTFAYSVDCSVTALVLPVGFTMLLLCWLFFCAVKKVNMVGEALWRERE